MLSRLITSANAAIMLFTIILAMPAALAFRLSGDAGGGRGERNGSAVLH
jgi:hypothetical protein